MPAWHVRTAKAKGGDDVKPVTSMTYESVIAKISIPGDVLYNHEDLNIELRIYRLTAVQETECVDDSVIELSRPQF
eukprot:589751-Alexandrium_andersonii.AAC.1